MLKYKEDAINLLGYLSELGIYSNFLGCSFMAHPPPPALAPAPPTPTHERRDDSRLLDLL